MNTNAEMPEIDSEMPENAVSIYGRSEDAYDDFPVLKAFQQYIDAEQSKARKRMLMICVFFGGLMLVVILVFVMLLMNVSSRNQMLNDRLVEYAMKDREPRPASAAVLQSSQDTSAILALTSKLEELQKKIAEGQAETEKIVSAATAKAKQSAFDSEKKKRPTPEALEIERLKALLASEREKLAVEREKQRQAELEEYRRKHYPELYEPKKHEEQKPSARPKKTEKTIDEDHEDLLKEVDQILMEGEAVTYFDEGESEHPGKKPLKQSVVAPSQQAPQPKEYSIPVEIRGSSSHWSVPND